MTMQIREPMTVIGFSARTSNAAESDPERAKIGALWGRVMSGALDAVPHRGGDRRITAVYHEYGSNQNGPYTILVGAVVDQTKPTDVPAGMVALEVPAAECAVFEARGEMPGALIETWMKIWGVFPNDQHERAFTSDVEFHAPDGSGADIWIATQRR